MFKTLNVLNKIVQIVIVLVLVMLPLSAINDFVSVALAEELQSDAVVLVNSASSSYDDFEHYIQPYLDTFGVPYTELDIATDPVGADIGDYAVIIIGHRQLDAAGANLDATEESHISAAVSAGTGLVNFDNDLSEGGTTPLYQFVEDIFGFGYVPSSTGSGVTFTSETGGGLQINCWEDDHQEPDLTTTTNAAALIPDDNQWTEFLYTNRGYPGVFAGYDETPPLMRFHASVPDGEYELVAHLYWSHNLRYYWGYTAEDPQAYSFDVTSGNSGDFADYALGTVTVTGGQFELYVRNADPLTGGLDYPFWGWAWIRLVPVGTPEPEMHYITERHTAGESISTGGMTMAGVTLPEGVTALAMTSSQPFLTVADYGAGHAVQWGSYNWMSHAVKGPIYGLDDLVWRSIVWAARKPFVMQGLPNFVTMRVDDADGPFQYAEIAADEFGIKPWIGLFYQNVSSSEVARLSSLVNDGKATAAVHAKTGAFFYYNGPGSGGDFDDDVIADNFADATAWHATNNIPISKFVLPHYYEFGTNVFQGLSNWGVEFVGTMMDPGTAYGAPWIMNGPYRLYETGGSSGGRPVYYAGFMSIPGHSEYDGQFFNCVTEIRDDAGYEWYPSNDVALSIGRGTRQTKRALDSMALATLFTHEQHVGPITAENWRAILQGVTENLVSYNPIYVTMDHACQYVRAMHTSDITASTYDTDTRQVTTIFGGETDMPTMFYLFTEQGDDIHHLLIDVPTFNGATTVNYTLAGPLDHIVVTPSSATVAVGGSQQFTAQGYDADDNPIPNLPFTWAVVNGGGTINASGFFTAGSTEGTFPDTVEASFGGISGYASVETIIPPVHHFTFETISNKYAGVPFDVTITARDAAENVVLGYGGQADLSDTTGTLSPIVTSSFVNGVWSGTVTISDVASGVTITAEDDGVTGVSNSFDVTTLEPGPYTIWGSTIPSSSYVGDTNAVELGVRFQAASNGYITGLRFWKDTGNNGAHVGHLWTANGTMLAEVAFTGETVSGWQQVMLPEPIPIQADITYVVSYHSTTGYNAARNYFSGSDYDNPPLRALADGEGGGNGVYCYDSDACTYPVNTYQASNYWVDVVFATDLEPPPPVCVDEPCSIWDDTFVPVQPSVDDQNTQLNGVELGVKFRSSVDGFVTGVRFYKGSSDTDDHPVHLWASDGTLLAEAEFTGPMTPGWKEVALAEPVSIMANTTYIASYHTSTPWALTRPGFTTGHDNPPLRALANGEDGGNGVYAYGTPSQFPASTYESSNYWVDVVFAGIPLNEPPVADAGGPYTYINEGDSVTLNASGSSDPDDNIVLYEWDLDNDGEYDDATGVTTNMVFDDNGTYTLGLRVTDDYGESDTDTADVLVDNVVPTLSLSGDASVDEGSLYTLNLSAVTDPGDDTISACTVDWGDGNSESCLVAIGSSQTHTYADGPNGYTIAVDLTDEDGTYLDVDTLGVTVNNVAPTLSLSGNASMNEGSLYTLNLSGVTDPGDDTILVCTVDWGDGNSESCLGAIGSSQTHTYADGPNSYTISVDLTDEDGTYLDVDTLGVTVNNVAPTLSLSGNASVDEGSLYTLNLSAVTDPGEDTISACNVDWGDGNSESCVGAIGSSQTHTYVDGPNSYTIAVDLIDEDGTYLDVDTLGVTVNNVAPNVTANPMSQSVQYSDHIVDVTFTATDVADDDITRITSWSVNGGGFTPGLPASLGLAGGCSANPTTNTCNWTLSGIVSVSEGTYTIRLSVSDEDGGQTNSDITITILPEAATVAFDDENTVAERVATPGGASGPFSLTAYVTEKLPDLPFTPAAGVAPGDISKANVTVMLVPVGPGSNVIPESCLNSVAPNGYAGKMTVYCDFSDVPVNTYTVEVTVGGGYYNGHNEDVLVIYDPSLGFATGGGWFYWPDTNEKTNFGFNMKYNKKGTKVQGSLLLIRHLADGTIYRVKSNALFGLALGEDTETPMGWATFSGKSTYLEPSWEVPEGNYTFIVYVEDRDEPGTGVDRFWIEVLDKDNNRVPQMSMDEPATEEANSQQLHGGNIVVPHGGPME